MEFVPNSPPNASPNSQSSDNRTLSETRSKLIAEIVASTDDVQADEAMNEQPSSLNVGASTSTQEVDEKTKFYYTSSVRKRASGKSIAEGSSSNESSTSEEWQLPSKHVKKYSKSSKTRRKGFSSLKKKKKSFTTASQKLSMLPSSEARKDEDKTSIEL